VPGIPRHAIAGLLAASLLLPACVSTRWEQPAPAVTKSTGSTQRGNPPFYEVFGRRYHVMKTSYGYRQQGVASWYGRKFHGRATSSGELYDMNAMTAAHKTLPLPTRVRVTNLANGRAVIVRVNDRGPFVDNRIIDLSYAAAKQLDMVRSGTALVEIEAVDTAGTQTARTPVIAAARPRARAASLNPIAAAVAEPAAGHDAVRLYLQVGAFGESLNATRLKAQLEKSGLENVVILYDARRVPALYRVRLGPIGSVDEYDQLVARVAALEIRETHLVTEPAGGRPVPGS